MIPRYYRCLVKWFAWSSLVAISFFIAQSACALTYKLPAADNALIGKLTYTHANEGDTLVTIGQRYNIGFSQMVDANPGIHPSMRLPADTIVRIPTSHLLPSLPRQGIVINLPEMRMYYYPAGSDTVMTYPIGIGRIGKTIPIARTSIVRKTINPTWTPTKSIREFNREQGIELPAVMPPGPDNPLGPYAIYLQIPTYLIHSTIFPESIGRRTSFGCIRMNETDIKEFFPIVKAGIPVLIVDMPTKVAWQGDKLYLEMHDSLEERSSVLSTPAGVKKMVEDALPAGEKVFIDWQLVHHLAEQRDGIPHDIGFKIN